MRLTVVAVWPSCPGDDRQARRPARMKIVFTSFASCRQAMRGERPSQARRFSRLFLLSPVIGLCAGSKHARRMTQHRARRPTRGRVASSREGVNLSSTVSVVVNVKYRFGRRPVRHPSRRNGVLAAKESIWQRCRRGKAVYPLLSVIAGGRGIFN